MEIGWALIMMFSEELCSILPGFRIGGSNFLLPGAPYFSTAKEYESLSPLSRNCDTVCFIPPILIGRHMFHD